MTRVAPTRVVVDASVLIAALMADGRARHVLTHGEARFYVPPFIFEEAEHHLDRICRRSGLAPEVVRAVLQDLGTQVEVVPAALLAPFMARAMELAMTADAEGDEAYVALALALGAPIWTYDKDFARIEGVETVGTSALLD